ncbi:hypothetical protein V6Z11_A08G192100 [Gossypium hirsutum]
MRGPYLANGSTRFPPPSPQPTLPRRMAKLQLPQNPTIASGVKPSDDVSVMQLWYVET